MHKSQVAQQLDTAFEHSKEGRAADARRVLGDVSRLPSLEEEQLRRAAELAIQLEDYDCASKLLERGCAAHPEASDLLLNLGVVYRRRGLPRESEAAYRRALAVDAANAAVYNNLANVVRDDGRYDEAIKLYRHAIDLEPRFLDATRNLGNLFVERGAVAEAEPLLRRAFEIAPDDAHTVNDFGNVEYALGQYVDAEALFRRAIALHPNFAPAHNNLGNALGALGKLGAAEAHFRKALALNADYAEAQSNLARVLREAGRLHEAKHACLRAIELRPNYADAFNHLGNICRDLGQLQEAIDNYERALAISGGHVHARANLANALKESGRLEEAVESYRRALELQPSFANAHSNLIFCLDLMDSVTLKAQQEERKLWYEIHGREFLKTIGRHSNDKDASRKLRIGYVSADFRRHSAYNAFGPVICGHGDAFEVFCYSGVKREDDATARLRGCVDHWFSTLGVSDHSLAAKIRSDRIDILLDLSGHSAGHRLQTFARKPAPVQITAWGHATGTGLATIDYLFADDIVIRKSEHHLFAEKIVELPCVVCYEAPAYMPDVSALPALANGYVTFGCINRLEKVTDSVIRLWGSVLQAVPGSRILIKDRGLNEEHVRVGLLRRFTDIAGIAAKRVMLEGWSPHREHLETFRRVDIALDPFPHGGGISTLEAFWMGIPVVTQFGTTIPSRLTASLLSRLAMPEWIGRTDEDYVSIAVHAANDLDRLTRLRHSLRARANASAFGNLTRYTTAVENAYRAAWRQWCIAAPA